MQFVEVVKVHFYERGTQMPFRRSAAALLLAVSALIAMATPAAAEPPPRGSRCNGVVDAVCTYCGDSFGSG